MSGKKGFASTPTLAEAPSELSADGFAKISEAQSFLGLSRATIYALMDSGQLAYAKFGRSRRIPRRALLQYAEQNIIDL